MHVVKVDLGERSYDIFLGENLFSDCAKFLQQSSYSKKALVITDQTVDRIYGEAFSQNLSSSGFELYKTIVVDGEEAKSLAWAERIYTKAIEAGLDRNSPFIALGGGVPGDLAGFAAATYMRGVPFVQVPTTLLAQVDSSVGGKVAVNHPLGKNMIGAFYQPDAVFASTDTLDTLSERDYASGLAEVVKYACLDEGRLLDFLEENTEKILARDKKVLADIIERCCLYKAKIVAEDERESGKRMYLNLGHTYGHTIETEGGFSRYSHGEAVAVGLNGALLLSEAVYGLDKAFSKRVIGLLQAFNLPVVADSLDKERAFSGLWHDKKATGGKLKWVLLKGKGDIEVNSTISNDLVIEVIDKIIV